MGVAAVQRHIEDKARRVWDGYLRTRLEGLTDQIPGVSDRVGALRIAVGVDPLDLPASAIDTLPPRNSKASCRFCVPSLQRWELTTPPTLRYKTGSRPVWAVWV